MNAVEERKFESDYRFRYRDYRKEERLRKQYITDYEGGQKKINYVEEDENDNYHREENRMANIKVHQAMDKMLNDLELELVRQGLK